MVSGLQRDSVAKTSSKTPDMMGCSGSPDEGKQIGANPYWLSYPPKDESVKVTFVALSFWPIHYWSLKTLSLCKLSVTTKIRL